MKKICVSLLMVAMLVCVLAPGVSALDRDWRMVVKQKAEKPEGDEGGWGSFQRVNDTSRPSIREISAWILGLFRVYVAYDETDSRTIDIAPLTGSVEHDHAQ